MPTPSRARLQYALDDRNRLVIRRGSETGTVRQQSHTVDGRLEIDDDNRLFYRLAEAVDAAVQAQRVDLDGTWHLGPDHRVSVAVKGSEGVASSVLTIRGVLTRMESNRFVIALGQADDEATAGTRELALSGRWAVDAQNRLAFLVRRADGAEDRLTLQGAWGLGPHHEIVYRYRSHRSKGEETLSVDGTWTIPGPNRLAYRIVGTPDSWLEFRVSIGSRSLTARDGRMLFNIGIGAAKRRTGHRLAFFGAWKLNRDLSLDFEFAAGQGRLQTIRFEGSVAVGARNRVTVALQSGKRESLGITLTLTQELSKRAQLFLRFQQRPDERAVMGGVQVRF